MVPQIMEWLLHGDLAGLPSGATDRALSLDDLAQKWEH